MTHRSRSLPFSAQRRETRAAVALVVATVAATIAASAVVLGCQRSRPASAADAAAVPAPAGLDAEHATMTADSQPNPVASGQTGWSDRAADGGPAQNRPLLPGASSRQAVRGDGAKGCYRLSALHDDASVRGPLASRLEALATGTDADADAAALRFAARYLGDDRNAVRLAAVGAVRDIAGVEATALLATAARHDAAPVVRAEAVYVLADRRDDVARAALEHVVREDGSDRVRRIALLALADRLGEHPDAERLLGDAATQDRSPQLCELAARALRRGALGGPRVPPGPRSRRRGGLRRCAPGLTEVGDVAARLRW